MNKLLFLLPLAFSANLYALDKTEASYIVKKYSDVIACQTESESELQYKAVKIADGWGEDEGMNMEQTYLVHWEGDVGCAGGNGTVMTNFTLVGQRGFESVPPIVVENQSFPDIEIKYVNKFSMNDGVIEILGEGYEGQKVNYKYTYKNEVFVAQ